MNLSENNPGISILGDSISTLQGWVPQGWRVHYEGEAHVEGIQKPLDTWWGRVISKLGGHLVANSSFSGSTVEGFGFPAGVSDERIAALAAHGVLPDVVLVFMGINDYGWGGALNQVLGGSTSASARREEVASELTKCEEYAGQTGGCGDQATERSGRILNHMDYTLPTAHVVMTVGRDALQRFQESYAQMLQKISQMVPQAEIWCVTLAPASKQSVSRAEEKPRDCGNPSGYRWRNSYEEPSGCFKFSIRGIPLEDYNQAIKNAVKQQGSRVHVADLAAYGVCYDAVDGVHPSALGMRQIAAMVVAQIQGQKANPEFLPELKNAQKAVRTCFKPTCEGCEFADTDPSVWTLYCQ